MFDTINTLKAKIASGAFDCALAELYASRADEQRERMASAAARFSEAFGDSREVGLFSAPGRTEIGGNHTDHQLGCVVAAAVTLDVIAVAGKNGTDTVRILSEGYPLLEVDSSSLIKRDDEENTTAALVRGILSRFADMEKTVCGFDAYITSNVPKGSGLSSSAAFSVLICTILDHVFNDGDMDAMTYAKTAQYAENVYFGKPSGLMDELASAHGGFVAIDFFDKDEPVVTPVPADLNALGYALVIVNAGGSHADLTDEYAAITRDMLEVAGFFGKPLLSRVSEADFYENLPALRRAAGDRAILRAMHFFDETARAKAEADALAKGDIDEFLSLANASGESSFMLLGNVTPHDPDERSIALALAYAKRLLGKRGACRIHGGGFAGTIQAFVPLDMAESFASCMDSVFGRGASALLSIRNKGGVRICEPARE